LNDNELTFLPNAISKLTNLRVLSACNNRLHTLPEMLSTSLEILDLRVNRLVSIPECVSKLCNLVTLRAGHNLIETLPEDMWDMSSLKRLELNNNHIAVFPDTIADIRSLRVLMLARNRLTKISDDFCTSQWLRRSLRVLWLHGNELRRLPRHIGLLENLRVIRTDSNPLRSPPPGIVRAGIKQIRKYIKIRRRRIRLIFNRLRAIRVEFDVTAIDPQAKNILTDGTGHMTKEDLKQCDELVDQYVNSDFYNRKQITDETIVRYVQNTIRERGKAYYRKTIDSFYDFVSLIQKYDLLPGSLFTTKIKMKWGMKLEVETEKKKNEEKEEEKKQQQENENDDKKEKDQDQDVKMERIMRRCFGIVLTSRRVMGPDPDSKADVLNAIFKKRKIKLNKGDSDYFRFDYTRKEVEDALEQYRGVYGRISKSAAVCRFRHCSCMLVFLSFFLHSLTTHTYTHIYTHTHTRTLTHSLTQQAQIEMYCVCATFHSRT